MDPRLLTRSLCLPVLIASLGVLTLAGTAHAQAGGDAGGTGGATGGTGGVTATRVEDDGDDSGKIGLAGLLGLVGLAGLLKRNNHRDVGHTRTTTHT